MEMFKRDKHIMLFNTQEKESCSVECRSVDDCLKIGVSEDWSVYFLVIG